MGQTRVESVMDPVPTDSQVRAIAETRADMSETINAIEERLSPSHLREQVMEQIDEARVVLRQQVQEEIQQLTGTLKDTVQEEISGIKDVLKTEYNEAKTAVHAATVGRVQTMVHNARDTVNDAGSSVFTTIRENPIPAALMGVGLVWLLMNGTSSGRRAGRQMGKYASGLAEQTEESASSALHRARDMGSNAVIKVRDATQAAGHAASTFAHDASETVGHMAHDASESMGHLAHRVTDTAGALATQTQHGAHAVEQTFERTLQDNPLALGAVAFALGTAVGLVIPSTRQEDYLMGQSRDMLLEKAEHLAHDTVQSAQANLSEAISGAGKPPAPDGERSLPSHHTL